MREQDATGPTANPTVDEGTKAKSRSTDKTWTLDANRATIRCTGAGDTDIAVLGETDGPATVTMQVKMFRLVTQIDKQAWSRACSTPIHINGPASPIISRMGATVSVALGTQSIRLTEPAFLGALDFGEELLEIAARRGTLRIIPASGEDVPSDEDEG